MTGRQISKQNSGINTLRGISILSVIFLHINTRVPFSGTYLGSITPAPVYKILFWSGFYGVCIFFVISGFLITTSSLNKWRKLPDIKLKGFYAMRFARIIPLLVSLLLVLSALHLTGVKGFIIDPERTSLGQSLFAALTFHINMLEIKTGYMPASWDILWSLSIEEVFYIFFPLICLIVRKEWQLIAMISVFLFISPFARTTFFVGNELGDRNYLAYIDSIALGCMAAVFTRRINVSKASMDILSIAGFAMFLFVFIFRSLVFKLGLTEAGLNISLLSAGTAIILIRMQNRHVNGLQKPLRFTKFLRFLGRNSYEVYLTHMFVVIMLVWLFDYFKLSGDWILLLYFLVVILSGIIGELVSRYFSSPLNGFLREQLSRNYRLPRSGDCTPAP